MFALSITILDIFIVKMYVTLTFKNRPWSNLNMLIKSPYAISYLMSISASTTAYMFIQAVVAVSVEALVFIVIGRSCSEGCGFHSTADRAVF